MLPIRGRTILANAALYLPFHEREGKRALRQLANGSEESVLAFCENLQFAAAERAARGDTEAAALVQETQILSAEASARTLVYVDGTEEPRRPLIDFLRSVGQLVAKTVTWIVKNWDIVWPIVKLVLALFGIVLPFAHEMGVEKAHDVACVAATQSCAEGSPEQDRPQQYLVLLLGNSPISTRAAADGDSVDYRHVTLTSETPIKVVTSVRYPAAV